MSGTMRKITKITPARGGSFVRLECGHEWFRGGLTATPDKIGMQLECKYSFCYHPDRYMGI